MSKSPKVDEIWIDSNPPYNEQWIALITDVEGKTVQFHWIDCSDLLSEMKEIQSFVDNYIFITDVFCEA